MSEQEKSLFDLASDAYDKAWNERGSLAYGNHRICLNTAVQAVAARVTEKIAQMVEDYNWMLPLSGNIGLDSATDDAAEAVRMQILASIRAMNEANQ